MPKPSNNIFYNLFARKISGQTSDVENKKFDELIASSDEAKRSFEDLNEIWSESFFSDNETELVSQNEARDEVWVKTFGSGKENRVRKFDLIYFAKIAAVISLFIAASVSFYYILDTQPTEVSEVTIIHKQTFSGQKSTITLPDGTEVWMNSESILTYTSDFNDSIRIITLEGQAYFDVFKDATKPFIVKCRDIEVEALGTSFDVNGYAGAPIQVSLLTGSVKLSVPSTNLNSNLVLYPGEYSIVDKKEIQEKGNFDPYEVLAWKEGRLIFQEQTLEEIIPKLEMWYGVKIENRSSLPSTKHFNGTFEKENLDNILHNIGLSMGFTHKIDGHTILIN